MKDQKDKQCRFIFLQPVLIIFTRGAMMMMHSMQEQKFFGDTQQSWEVVFDNTIVFKIFAI